MKLTDRKKRDILAAAIIEFEENGFVAARTSRIAQRASVSSRTLYNHFENKEVLFEAIIEIVFAKVNALPHSLLDSQKPLREQMVAVATGYIDAVAADEFMVLNRITNSEYLRNADLARRTFAHNALQENPVEDLIDQAMRAGLLRRESPGYAAQQLVSMLKGFTFWPRLILGENMTLPKPQEEIIEDSIDMFLTHYQTSSPKNEIV